ncbi:MAG: hypothetical protein IJ264_00100, partial [Clostridia bacterium]|nr:hypothetical protein [Clostridia bacterium]
MEKTNTLRETDISDRLWEYGTKIMACTLYFVSGFILSGASLLSLNVPLSIGLSAACTGVELIFAVLGGILGGILRLDGSELINAAVPLAGMAGTVFITDRLNIHKKRRAVLSVSAFLLSFACRTAVMFSQ